MKTIFSSVMVTVFVLFWIGPLGCRMTEGGVTLYEKNPECPKITSFLVGSEKEIFMETSKKVSVSELKLDGCEIPDPLVQENKICCVFENETQTGQVYELEGVLTDELGSSLTFSIEFSGFNVNPAGLALSEIRSEATGSGGKYNDEYVELVCLSDGNLSGIEIVSAMDGEEKSFRLPAVEVRKGEFVTAHFRNRNGKDVCRNEISGNLCESTAKDSCETAWDFWADNTESRISKTDVIVLRDYNSKKMLDFVAFADEGKTDWNKDLEKEFLQQAVENGFWDGTEICYAANSSNATYARTLCRNDLVEMIAEGKWKKGSKDVWSVGEKANSSPGKLSR